MKAADLDILLQEGEGVMLEYKEGLSASFIFYPNPEVRVQAEAKKGPRRDQVQAHDQAHETLESTAHVPDMYPVSTPQVGTKSALSRHQVEMLRKCNEDRMLIDLMAITGRSDRTKFRHQVLNPLLKAGFIEMTFPDKPRSSKQRYRITASGRRVLENAEKESPS